MVSVPLLERGFFATSSGETAADAFAARVGMVALRGYWALSPTLRARSTRCARFRPALTQALTSDNQRFEELVFDQRPPSVDRPCGSLSTEAPPSQHARGPVRIP